MHVNWTTLEAIAATKAIDVWYLFPLSATVRQAAVTADAMSPAKRSRLTAMLGTNRWRSEWYAATPQMGLFGDESDERTATQGQILKWVTARLGEIFPMVLEPLLLCYQTPS